MKRGGWLTLWALVFFFTLHVGADETAIRHLHEGHFLYRDREVQFNVHATRFLLALLRHGDFESDIDLAVDMGWRVFKAPGQAESLVHNINHQALLFTGATLLKHDKKHERVGFELIQKPALQDASQVQTPFGVYTFSSAPKRILLRLAIKLYRRPELLSVTEAEFADIGLPFEEFKRALGIINQTVMMRPQASVWIKRVNIQILKTVYHTSWDENLRRFEKFSPLLHIHPDEGCESAVTDQAT